MGKVIYGNRNFGYAPITNSGGSYAFGTPVFLKGMVSASAEVEESKTNKYADDMVYCVFGGAKTRNLSVTLAYVSEAYAEMLGFRKETNGMLVDTNFKPNHCVFFETTERDCETNEETHTLHYFYNVVASQPALSSNTTEEEVESADLEIEYSAYDSTFVVDGDGKYVGYGKITRTSENASLYDQFTTKVILPTDSI